MAGRSRKGPIPWSITSTKKLHDGKCDEDVRQAGGIAPLVLDEVQAKDDQDDRACRREHNAGDDKANRDRVLSPSLAAALPLMSAVMTCHIKTATDGSVPTPDRMHRTAYTLMMRGIFLTSVALGTLGSSSFRSIQNLSRFVLGY